MPKKKDWFERELKRKDAIIDELRKENAILVKTALVESRKLVELQKHVGRLLKKS